MNQTASWPYQMRVDNIPQFVGAPGPPVSTAIASFRQFGNGLWVWDVEPSILGEFTTTFLSVLITFEDDEPKTYQWQYDFLQPPLPLWTSNQDSIPWDRPGGGRFFPQASDLQFFIRNATVPLNSFRSFVTIARHCFATGIEV